MATTPPRLTGSRQVSRVPGGFDTDEDLSPIKTTFDYEHSEHNEPSSPSHTTTASHQLSEDDSMNAPSHDGRSITAGEGDTFLQEREMRKQLEDVDSTFLPNVSPATHTKVNESGDFDHDSFATMVQQANLETDKQSMDPPGKNKGTLMHSPATPPEMYRTPAPGRDNSRSKDTSDTDDVHRHPNTSSRESMSSSPTVAAAARTVSRAVSMASMDRGYETADDSRGGIALEQSSPGAETDDHPTPRKVRPANASTSRRNSSIPIKSSKIQASDEATDASGSVQHQKRPQLFNSRKASQMSSYSSHTTTSTQGGSEVTVGADYALQSGGAVPQGSLSSRPTEFSRTISLGSMASGISDLSDREDRLALPERNLHTLDEEDDTERDDMLNAERYDRRVLQTPRVTSKNIITPTDTVIAQHVRDIEVPVNVAREYRDRHGQPSPEKRNGAPTPSARGGKSMTLKEQSSTIDRLMKENWDLKLKINFLDDALSRRSDEGVKAMISENVDLRTAKFKSAKEMRELKRANRELERKLQEKIDELMHRAQVPDSAKFETGRKSEDFQFMESELTYFRERMMTYEIEVEKMRQESSAQEKEKKQLAEMLKRVSETKGDIGVHEEVVSIEAFLNQFHVLTKDVVGYVERPSRRGDCASGAGG